MPSLAFINVFFEQYTVFLLPILGGLIGVSLLAHIIRFTYIEHHQREQKKNMFFAGVLFLCALPLLGGGIILEEGWQKGVCILGLFFVFLFSLQYLWKKILFRGGISYWSTGKGWSFGGGFGAGNTVKRIGTGGAWR